MSIERENNAQAMSALLTFRCLLSASLAQNKPDERVLNATAKASRSAEQRLSGMPKSEERYHPGLTRTLAVASEVARATHRGRVDPKDQNITMAVRIDEYSDCKSTEELTSQHRVTIGLQLQRLTKNLPSSGKSVLKLRGAWDFWQLWYFRAVDGDPLPWELQRRIALIADEEWSKGPERIADLIREIEDQLRPNAPQEELAKASRRAAEHAVRTELAAVGLAEQIDASVAEYLAATGQNCLPDEFAALDDLPRVLRRLGRDLHAAEDREAKLQRDIAELHAQIVRLETDLKLALSKTLSGRFSAGFWDQAGKSLGSWQLWSAVVAGGFYLLTTPTLSQPVEGIATTCQQLFPKSGVAVPPDLPPTVEL
ncbi:hypothetical protein DXV76_07430 [Rhodobacteraceae bacterium CCMM004]|nr:hypothetical protein DXV76_07430 [Rhodobacteraceae bacterium CCMM004]